MPALYDLCTLAIIQCCNYSLSFMIEIALPHKILQSANHPKWCIMLTAIYTHIRTLQWPSPPLTWKELKEAVLRPHTLFLQCIRDIRMLLQCSKYIVQIHVCEHVLCSKCMHSTYTVQRNRGVMK